MKASIKYRFAVIFIVVMTVMLALCWCANSFFLERFYTTQKLELLLDAYTEINTRANQGEITQIEFATHLTSLCETHNISVLIIDLEEKTQICAGTSNVQEMQIRLMNNVLLGYMEFENEQKSEDEQKTDESEAKFNLIPEKKGSKEHFSSSPSDIIYEDTDTYTIRSTVDSVSNNEYIEMWGFLDQGELFMIRTMKAAIKESVKISNKFLLYTGIVSVVIGSVAIFFVTNRMTRPIRQLNAISKSMAELDFNVKYEQKRKKKDEIDLLGDNINSLSEALEKTILELKTANIELQRDNEKKTKIDEMRKEFLSNVTHELKTPIALIQGYAEGLKEGITDDPESMDFYCEVIIDEAGKMNQMVKNLLTLNHLEFGNAVLTMERFDIVALITNYLSSSAILMKQNDVQVRFFEKDPIYVWGDEFKTEEVFMNYLSNALHYVDDNKLIDIKLWQHDGVVRISVFNTGLPIPEESIPYLWDKFYKVDKARTREYGGSGVGLSIVKAIMESMNQNYGVTNYDNGVEFWFELETQPVMKTS